MRRVLLPFILFFCCALAVNAQYYTEDFEAGLPADWTAENAWVHGDAAAHSSQYFAIPAHTMFMGVNDDAAGAGVGTSGRLITGDIDLTGAPAGVILEFQAFFYDGDYDADETAKVLVSTDAGATWTEVADLGGDTGAWQNAQANLIGYGGQTIRLAFDYQDGGGWNYGFCVDDLAIVDAPAFGVSMVSAEASCTSTTVGGNVVMSGTFMNEGAETITSIDINWSDGTNSYTETLTGLNVPIFESYSFVHPVDFTALNGNTPVEISVSNPNGMADPNTADNMTNTNVRGVTPAEGKSVVVEEATGTWCTWCPRGAVFLDRFSDCFPENFIGIAVHNDDPMELTAYDAGLTGWPGFEGFPSVLMSRVALMDPADIEAPFIQQVQEAPDALIQNGATYDETTRALTVSVSADVLEVLGNGGRFNAILVEDGLSGTSADWAQVNAYSGGGNGPMGGYENLPSPVPASMMVYDHVGVALIGGFAGPAGSVADDAEVGTTIGHVFDTYTIPTSINTDNTHIVGVLYNAAGQIVNASSTTIDEAVSNGLFQSTSSKDVFKNELAEVFPNPFNDVTNIRLNLESASNVNLQVFNAVGQKVAAKDYGTLSGVVTLPFSGVNLESGIYTIHISVDDVLITKRVTLSK